MDRGVGIEMNYNTTKTLVAVVVILLSALACGQYITPTPTTVDEIITTVTPLSPTRTATVPTATSVQFTTVKQQSATVVQAVVNVRTAPDGDVIGFLRAGDVVNVLECSELWCKIESPAGYVWRGCLSDNPENLGCSTK
jgi:hypothetical protein